MRGITRGFVVRLLAGVGLVAAITTTAAAQTLADLAKKEEARRKAIKGSGKVLTGDSIRAVPAPPMPPPPAAPAPGASSGAPEAAQGEKPKPEEDRKAQETAWRSRMQGARDDLQRSQMFAEALQSRINGLTADFTARDDPAQRAVVAGDRQKALAELDRVRNDITKQTKAIQDIETDARRSNIPPGWLR